jgi:hypothetical protein
MNRLVGLDQGGRVPIMISSAPVATTLMKTRSSCPGTRPIAMPSPELVASIGLPGADLMIARSHDVSTPTPNRRLQLGLFSRKHQRVINHKRLVIHMA